MGGIGPTLPPDNPCGASLRERDQNNDDRVCRLRRWLVRTANERQEYGQAEARREEYCAEDYARRRVAKAVHKTILRLIGVGTTGVSLLRLLIARGCAS